MEATKFQIRQPGSRDCGSLFLGPLICSLLVVFYSTSFLPGSLAASQNTAASSLSRSLKDGGGRFLGEDPLKPVLRGRQLSDWEVASVAMTRSIIANPSPASTLLGAKVAFLFRVEGPLPLETLWSRFLNGHAGQYTIYIHSSGNYQYVRENLKTDLFVSRSIPSHPVEAGSMSEVEAERRLLSWALLDPANHFFVLVSQNCVPIRGFPFIHDYLIRSRTSFVELFPGDSLRYHADMEPEIPRHKFVSGSEWVALHRRHATAVVADTLFYDKFQHSCQLVEGESRCAPVEHYLHTFLHTMDPKGLANYSVTHVPKLAMSMQSKQMAHADRTKEVIASIQVRNWPLVISGRKVNFWGGQATESIQGLKEGQGPSVCRRNGEQAPCFLFVEGVQSSALSAVESLSVDILGY